MSMEATEQEKGQVEEIISRIAQAQELDNEAARMLLLRYGCAGDCDWYRIKSETEGFRKGGLTDEEKAAVEAAMSEVLPGAGIEEIWQVVHGVMCADRPGKKPS